MSLYIDLEAAKEFGMDKDSERNCLERIKNSIYLLKTHVIQGYLDPNLPQYAKINEETSREDREYYHPEIRG